LLYDSVPSLTWFISVIKTSSAFLLNLFIFFMTVLLWQLSWVKDFYSFTSWKLVDLALAECCFFSIATCKKFLLSCFLSFLPLCTTSCSPLNHALSVISIYISVLLVNIALSFPVSTFHHTWWFQHP
jgi:hypothetical protein